MFCRVNVILLHLRCVSLLFAGQQASPRTLSPKRVDPKTPEPSQVQGGSQRVRPASVADQMMQKPVTVQRALGASPFFKPQTKSTLNAKHQKPKP